MDLCAGRLIHILDRKVTVLIVQCNCIILNTTPAHFCVIQNSNTQITVSDKSVAGNRHIIGIEYSQIGIV